MASIHKYRTCSGILFTLFTSLLLMSNVLIAQSIPTPCGTVVADADGNKYTTKDFGRAGCWMTQNLRTYTSKKGGPKINPGYVLPNANTINIHTPAIIHSTDSAIRYYESHTDSLIDGVVVVSNDVFTQKFGLLYSWYQAMDGSMIAGARGICPKGWHIPTDAEWSLLEGVIGAALSGDTAGWNKAIDFRGSATMLSASMKAGVKYYGEAGKTTDLYLWNNASVLNSSRISGFNVYPAGSILTNGIEGNNFGRFAYMWTSSMDNRGKPWFRDFSYVNNGVFRHVTNREYSFSVRCKQNGTGDTSIIKVPVSTIDEALGVGCTSVKDAEGNIYSAKYYGEAGCWMTQNLRTYTNIDGGPKMNHGYWTKDGGLIRIDQPNLARNKGKLLQYYEHPDQKKGDQLTVTYDAFAEKFGLLYNWKQVMNGGVKEGVRGICPEGWHIPTDAEWSQLEKTIGMSYGVAISEDTTGWSTVDYGRTMTPHLGTAMKLNENFYGDAVLPSFRWQWGETGDPLLVNVSGFGIVPAGGVDTDDNTPMSFGSNAYFWSSTRHNSIYAWHRGFGVSGADIHRLAESVSYSFSVRCKKN